MRLANERNTAKEICGEMCRKRSRSGSRYNVVYSFAARFNWPRSSVFNSRTALAASARNPTRRSAYVRNTSPAAVSEPSRDGRSKSGSPNSSSNLRITWLTAGCVRRRRCAAREKLRSSTTARKVSNCCRSISKYQSEKSIDAYY